MALLFALAGLLCGMVVAQANDNPALSEASFREPGTYFKEYAGKYVRFPRNESDSEQWRDTFVKEYAGNEAEGYRQRGSAGAGSGASRRPAAARVPQRASESKTVHALREWRDAQRARIQDYVPKDYQSSATDALEEEYAVNKARLELAAKAAKAEAGAGATQAAPAHAISGQAETRQAPRRRPLVGLRGGGVRTPSPAAAGNAANTDSALTAAPATVKAPLGLAELEATDRSMPLPPVTDEFMPPPKAAVGLPAPVALVLGGCVASGFIAAAAFSAARAIASRGNDQGLDYILVA